LFAFLGTRGENLLAEHRRLNFKKWELDKALSGPAPLGRKKQLKRKMKDDHEEGEGDRSEDERRIRKEEERNVLKKMEEEAMYKNKDHDDDEEEEQEWQHQD
jgi:hypothetical protein